MTQLLDMIAAAVAENGNAWLTIDLVGAAKGAPKCHNSVLAWFIAGCWERGLVATWDPKGRYLYVVSLEAAERGPRK